MEWTRNDYTLTDDTARVNVPAVHGLLSTSYWAPDRTAEVICASLDRSLCFSLLYGSNQIGFGRFVTDHATFSWFCDFIIESGHRANGLGKWMLTIMLEHPAVRDTNLPRNAGRTRALPALWIRGQGNDEAACAAVTRL